VQESVEELINWTASIDAINRVDPHESARAIVSSEHTPGGSNANVNCKLNPTIMNSLEPVKEEWFESRDRRLKSSSRRRRGKPGHRLGW
jgi:hypothetical protein